MIFPMVTRCQVFFLKKKKVCLRKYRVKKAETKNFQVNRICVYMSVNVFYHGHPQIFVPVYFLVVATMWNSSLTLRRLHLFSSYRQSSLRLKPKTHV